MTASIIFLNFISSCNSSPVQDRIPKSSENSSINFKDILYNCTISPGTQTVNNSFLKILVCPYVSTSYENVGKPFFTYLAPVQEIPSKLMLDNKKGSFYKSSVNGIVHKLPNSKFDCPLLAKMLWIILFYLIDILKIK